MLDWLWNADLWIKIAGVMTAVFSLVTAVISLKKTRAPEHATAAGALRSDQVATATTGPLRLVLLPSEPSKPWSPLWLKSAVIVLGIMSAAFSVLSLFFFISDQSLTALFPLVFFGGCTIAYVLVGKRLWTDPKQGSLVKREVTFKIQGSNDKLWDGCIAALKRMKVEIKTIDATKGLIEGKTGLTWKSFGEILVIQISKTGQDEYDVHVKSDSTMITTALDYGKNASNIRRFIQELVL